MELPKLTLEGFFTTLFTKVRSVSLVPLKHRVIKGRCGTEGILHREDDQDRKYRISIEEDLSIDRQCLVLVHEVIHANRGAHDRIESVLASLVGTTEEYEDQIEEEALAFTLQHPHIVFCAFLSRISTRPPPP
jgi:hypothetical protein